MNDFSIADLKAGLDFTNEQIAEYKKQLELYPDEPETAHNVFQDLKRQFESALFFKVMQLHVKS